MTYNAAPTVVFSHNTTLAPANVVLKWDNNHGSGKNSTGAFCTQSSSGTERGFSVQSGFISAGSYNGVDIFKTNIQGLYFSLKLHNFSAANQFTVNVTELNIRNSIQSNVLTPIPSGNWCDKTNTSGGVNYATDGGFAFYNTITFYTDQTYVPGGNSIQLLTNGYGLRIWNESPYQVLPATTSLSLTISAKSKSANPPARLNQLSAAVLSTWGATARVIFSQVRRQYLSLFSSQAAEGSTILT